MRGVFFLVQLLDGFKTTRENATGRLPQIIVEGVFKDGAVPQRVRTGGGTLDVSEATRQQRNSSVSGYAAESSPGPREALLCSCPGTDPAAARTSASRG
jgi:hypothetical protein